VPDAHQIAVVDLEAGRQTGTWQMPDLRANFPMALDPARGIALSSSATRPVSLRSI
jgi:hypothetical protein